MPPTINNTTAPTNGATDKRPQQRPTERRSELICRVKYGNTLPDIPFDLKFLQYPFDSHRFVQYNPTSLERNYKYEVLTEHDLGVTIDLINRDLYQSDGFTQLDPADEKLLEEDVHTQHDSVRSKQHSRSVSWLRKSEYISTEQTRFQPQNLENIESKVGYNVKKSLREETRYLDRDAQITAIEKTFADSKTEISKHYSKPNVVPVEVLPVYPDFSNWKYPCAQVIFDSDPAPIGKNVPAQIEEMSQAMIRGVMDESGEQFVAYFLPTELTLEKRRQDFADNMIYRDEEEYEYRIAREYNWNVKSKATKGYEENYFFVVRQEGVYYNELETRVRLNKRRVKAGQAPNNTKLVVKHRPLDANEHRMQRYREKQLEPAGDDDEEEEMEDMHEFEDDEIQKTQKTGEKAAAEKAKDGDSEAPSTSAAAAAAAASSAAEDKESAAQKARERQSRSRTRSGSKSRSQTRSRSRSRSGSAKSGSRTPSRSRSRSHSGSGSRSRSVSRSRSKSGSRSPAGSKAGSRSRSRSRSGSGSRSGSHSRTPSRSRSRSGSHSPSRSRSRSGTRSRSHSKSPMGSRSGSASPAGSQHSARSGSHSVSRSKSRSKSASRSRSRSRSASGSRSGSASRSGSPSASGSGSDEE